MLSPSACICASGWRWWSAWPCSRCAWPGPGILPKSSAPRTAPRLPRARWCSRALRARCWWRGVATASPARPWMACVLKLPPGTGRSMSYGWRHASGVRAALPRVTVPSPSGCGRRSAFCGCWAWSAWRWLWACSPSFAVCSSVWKTCSAASSALARAICRCVSPSMVMTRWRIWRTSSTPLQRASRP